MAGSDAVTQRNVSLVVLGTGHGSSMVYDNVCSAAYVLCVDKDPVLLIGAGYGVVQQCLRFFGRVPSDIFISSNRSHVAAELPVMLAREAAERQHPLRLLGHQSVLERVERYRLGELHDVMRARSDLMSSLVELCPTPLLTPESASTGFDHAEGIVLRDAPGVSIRCFPTGTSEMSAGVAIYYSHSGGKKLVALTGDCANPEATIRRYNLNAFHVVVLDGRAQTSSDHASFETLTTLALGPLWSGSGLPEATQRWFIGHYGSAEDAPRPHVHMSNSRLQPVMEGMLVHIRLHVVLQKESMNSSVAVSEVCTSLALPNATTPAPQSQHTRGGTQSNATQVKPAATVRSSSPAVATRFQQPTASSAHRKTSQHRQSATRSAAQLETTPTVEAQPKRIYLFNNEDRSASGRLLMVQAYRSIQQVKLRAADILQMQPVLELHVMPSGAVATSVQQLSHGACVVVTKAGGEPFNIARLPKALSQQHSASSRTQARSPRSSASNRRGDTDSHPSPPSPKLAEYMAQASAILAASSARSMHQTTFHDLQDVRQTHHDPQVLFAGPLPLGATPQPVVPQPVVHEASLDSDRPGEKQTPQPSGSTVLQTSTVLQDSHRQLQTSTALQPSVAPQVRLTTPRRIVLTMSSQA